MSKNFECKCEVKEIKTYRELQRELNKLYKRLRPKTYIPHWTDKPEIRKQIDDLLDREYVRVYKNEQHKKNIHRDG